MRLALSAQLSKTICLEMGNIINSHTFSQMANLNISLCVTLNYKRCGLPLFIILKIDLLFNSVTGGNQWN